jgi:DNA-binding transcriptional LysR family regulator
VIAMLSNAGIHPRMRHLARSWMMIVGMVAQVGGAALVPRSLLRARVYGVRFVPFSDAPSVAPAMLVWNPAGTSKVLRWFLECARDVVATQKTPARRSAMRRVTRKTPR